MLSLITIFITSITLLSTTYLVNKNIEIKNNFTKQIDIGRPNWGNSNQIWNRENAYINDNIYFYEGGGYEIKSTTYNVFKYNPNPIKILMIGDSYTWGNGNVDQNDNLAQMLQEKLNSSTKANTFMVIPYAANGRSTFNHVDEFTIKKIKEIAPDYIIYNFVFNDTIPSFNESMICLKDSIKDCGLSSPANNPTYLKCMDGSYNVSGSIIKNIFGKYYKNIADKLQTRNCDPVLKKARAVNFNEEEAMRDPMSNPYYSIWKESVKRLKDQSSGIPFGVANISIRSVPKKTDASNLSIFKNNGYTIIPLPLLNKALDSKDGGYMSNWIYTNPGNAHYSAHAAYLYSEDVSKEIISNLGLERIKKSFTDLKEPIGPLIASTMPISINTPNNEINSSNFELLATTSNERYIQKISGVAVPSQNVSCTNLGYANIGLNLRRRELEGSKITVNIDKKYSSRSFTLGYFYYDNEYKNHYKEVGLIDQDLTFNYPGNIKGLTIIISEKAVGYGCNINKEIKMLPFKGSITLAKVGVK